MTLAQVYLYFDPSEGMTHSDAVQKVFGGADARTYHNAILKSEMQRQGMDVPDLDSMTIDQLKVLWAKVFRTGD